MRQIFMYTKRIKSNKALYLLSCLQVSGTAVLNETYLNKIITFLNAMFLVVIIFKITFSIEKQHVSPINFFSGSTMTVSIFTVTSKSAVVRWSRYEGAQSYRVTASLRNSAVPVVFATFGQNTVMGSVNSLTPNTLYTFRVEAIGNLNNMLADISADGSTGAYFLKSSDYV